MFKLFPLLLLKYVCLVIGFENEYRFELKNKKKIKVNPVKEQKVKVVNKCSLFTLLFLKYELGLKMSKNWNKKK